MEFIMPIKTWKNLIFLFVMLFSEISLAESNYPEKVPGNSFANSAPQMMKELYGRALSIAKEKYDCASIEVLNTEITRVLPPDGSNPLLGKSSAEKWVLNACGSNFELFFGLVSLKTTPPRFVISVAMKKVSSEDDDL